MRGTWFTIAGFKGGGSWPQAKECGWPVEAKKCPAKKRGTQGYNYKELNSANNLKEQGSILFFKGSRKECSPANTLILVC